MSVKAQDLIPPYNHLLQSDNQNTFTLLVPRHQSP